MPEDSSIHSSAIIHPNAKIETGVAIGEYGEPADVDRIGALWHLDFHGSRYISVLLPSGTRIKPALFGVLDDHSRLCCHAQFYHAEKTETLVHGLCQAFQKRGLPRALLTDNGGPMLAAEVRQGLIRLEGPGDGRHQHQADRPGADLLPWHPEPESPMCL